MGGRLVGHVTALLARDPSHTAPPFEIEIFAPAEPAGSRTRRFYFKGLCDTRELTMVSVLRDAMVHQLAVSVSFRDDNQLDTVELAVPAIETYLEGTTHDISGIIRWLDIREAKMGETPRGQPDTVSVNLDNGSALVLVLERRNAGTKYAQLEMLREAQRAGTQVWLNFMDYPTAPGLSIKVIVGVGVGSKPL